ncbi:hypothetical protein JOD57_000208 [Geodermatophilus bullaregiensis]|uniref:hypothetical protein n=1 Tax=Geodermatophilus bullaregiensis TaxID=1564160 RepID=UPI001956F168|nr:hypothetical protein [Geodermatophilus bullaregiensis]MBM7804371.1 hypothetical protein [Geodermatophilus bullaregiensis]
MKYPGEKVAVVQPAFEAALWRARAMERQSALVVAGRPRRLLLEMLLSIIVYLLGVLDSLEAAGHGEPEVEEPRRVHRIDKAVRIAQRELTRLQHFVDRAAIRTALRHYLLGVSLGGVAVSASAWTTSRIPMFEQTATQDLVRAIAAGGLGAVISVMIRISHGQRLDVDTTQDDFMTCMAGSFRPVIGGALGVALYVLLQAGLTPLEIPEQAVTPRTSSRPSPSWPVSASAGPRTPSSGAHPCPSPRAPLAPRRRARRSPPRTRTRPSHPRPPAWAVENASDDRARRDHPGPGTGPDLRIPIVAHTPGSVGCTRRAPAARAVPSGPSSGRRRKTSGDVSDLADRLTP